MPPNWMEPGGGQLSKDADCHSRIFKFVSPPQLSWDPNYEQENM